MQRTESGKQRKFIVITGGVISGLGKGTATASIGALLQASGFRVSIIKIDPYINIDAGTMRPTEHGEVFVTHDGGETDQDLGIYERFLGKPLNSINSITTGQVYQKVIEKERNLEFDGKCVEVIPHIPEEVERRIKDVAEKTDSDFTLVEVGGTVGDYQNVLFLDALRAMKIRSEPVVFIHLVYLPVPNNLGEMKTKPAQHSVRTLNELGIQPDFLVTRSEKELDDVRRRKLSMFCNVSPENVISNPDVDLIYEMPLIFMKQDFLSKILTKFGTKDGDCDLEKWKGLISRIKGLGREVRIGIVGKYFDIGDFTLEDSYISVIEAIKHASWNLGLCPKIEWIDSKGFEKNPKLLDGIKGYDGIIVPGGFGSSGVEGKISAIRFCRENRIPYLGLCYGMHLAVVEFARNACGMEKANTTETDSKTRYPVIDILPEQVELLKKKKYGATMRLGSWPAILKKGSLVHSVYGKDQVEERHRHRYEVNPKFITKLESKGLVFSGASPDRKLMEFMEVPKHPFFVATQAHPEFTSGFLKPNPLFLGFVKASSGKKPA
jgi:CTP synthase